VVVAHLEEQFQLLMLVLEDASFCSRWMQALEDTTNAR
jgi:hypothetical protein